MIARTHTAPETPGTVAFIFRFAAAKAVGPGKQRHMLELNSRTLKTPMTLFNQSHPNLGDWSF
jgi:hypothetical protein